MNEDLPKTFGAFLFEALGLLGQREVIIAAASAFVIVWIALWISAKLIDRKERHFGAAFSSSLMLVLMGASVGVIYLALLLKELSVSGNPPSNGTLYVCVGVSAFLLLMTIQGAFGTAWWRTVILVIVLAASATGSTMIGHRFILEGRATQLPVLAAEVAGVKTEEPSLIKSEELKKLANQHSLRFEKRNIAKRQEALLKTYLALQAERAQLNVADQTAVTLFNEHAAAYQKEKQYLQTRQAELDALMPSAPAAGAEQKK